MPPIRTKYKPVFLLAVALGLLLAPRPPAAAPEGARGFYPNGILGEYFDDPDDATADLGQPPPSIPFSRYVFRRVDPQIDFVWNEPKSPDPQIGPEYWSARFTGQVQVDRTEDFVFSLEQLDDAGRLYVDGERVIDSWLIQAPWPHFSRPLRLEKGRHDLLVEYHQGPGPEGAVRLCWHSPTRPKEMVPFVDGVKAEYFDDPDAPTFGLRQPPPGPFFTGEPLVRREETIAFHWGPTPHPDMDALYWSARWTGRLLVPKTEPYTFYLENLDDAGRLYLNGQLIIDAWRLQQLESVASRPLRLEAGLHDIRVEFMQGEPPAGSIRVCWSSPSRPKEVIPPAGDRPEKD